MEEGRRTLQCVALLTEVLAVGGVERLCRVLTTLRACAVSLPCLALPLHVCRTASFNHASAALSLSALPA